ncbi:Cytochrome b5 4 [Cyphellophora attinorum]|uniref:Cytochrome b5 4 n=1 Tax=Cyphellophora attinorum TaxID=1664694 RepID=A0A0N1H3V1_9EURO|nr:Cytochrome b5 4 [Phialophora attinorum]KPI39684.1 Cytochrome b5 4 [Phialophora attinorum]
MGWIAAGAGTLIATCLIYTFLTRHANGEPQERGASTSLEKKEQQNGEIVSNGAVTDHLTSAATTRQSSHGNVPAPPSIVAPDEAPVPSISTSTTAGDTPASPQFAIPHHHASNLLPCASTSTLAAASLRVPATKVLSNTHMQPASSTLPIPTTQNTKKSRQITLAPGYSPLDWATLTKSRNAQTTLLGHDFQRLSPSGALMKIPPSLLKQQTGRKGKDAWTSYKGRVYNVTPYLNFHPGGKAELLRAAGREGEALFMEVHPWVNWEGMLGECCVGILVGEGEGSLQKEKEMALLSKEHGQGEVGNELDEMD